MHPHTLTCQNACCSMKKAVGRNLCVEQADTLAKFPLQVFQALKSDFAGCVLGALKCFCLFGVLDESL